jgi:hypothetical protein
MSNENNQFYANLIKNQITKQLKKFSADKWTTACRQGLANQWKQEAIIHARTLGLEITNLI